MNPAPNRSSIGALVVNHNGGQRILNCLEALIRQRTRLEEILVIDNGSTDGTPAEISRLYAHVKLVRLQENLGLSKARNIGIQQTTTDRVLVIDDDVYVDTDCIHYLNQAQTQYEATVVCPRILLYPDSQTIQCDGAAPHFVGTLALRHPYQPLERNPPEVSEVTGCIGACILVDRREVLAGGGFDEEYFFYFEDLEFSLRMRGLGYRIICEPRARVYHDRGTGRPQLSFRGHEEYPAQRAYFNIRHRLMTILIHYRVRTLLVLVPVLLVYELMILAISIRRGWIKHWWAAVQSVYAARVHIAARRQFVMRNRQLLDRELLTGGGIPLAQGFLRSTFERTIFRVLSATLNLYWKVSRHFIG